MSLVNSNERFGNEHLRRPTEQSSTLSEILSEFCSKTSRNNRTNHAGCCTEVHRGYETIEGRR